MRRLGDLQGESLVLGNLALLAAAQGEEGGLERAVALHEAAITIDRGLGYKRSQAVELDYLSSVLRRQGDLEAAYGCVADTLDLWLELGDPVDLAFWLDLVAELETAEGRSESASRFLGAAESLPADVGHAQDRSDGAEENESAVAVRAGMSESEFNAAWAERQALGRERMVEDARRILADRLGTRS